MWSTKQLPLVVVFATCELVVELAADVVGAHALSNFLFPRFDVDADLLDVVCGVVHVFDALWWLLDHFVDLIELGGDHVVRLDCSLGNELDLLLNNGLIFSSVNEPDVLDTDLEDGHSDLLWDSLLELGLELSIPVDVGSQGLGVYRCVSFVHLLHVLVWLELELLLELAKGLHILVQGLDGDCKGSPQRGISLPQPAILVLQQGLLVGIDGSRLVKRPEWCLKHLFPLGLEELLQ